MKVYVATDGPSYEVKEIKFCCGEMAEDILFGRVKVTPWTDHLNFYVKDAKDNCCSLDYRPHCGSKMERICLD